jgi:hypothetical protein
MNSFERRTGKLERRAPQPPCKHERLPGVLFRYYETEPEDEAAFERSLENHNRIKDACPNCRNNRTVIIVHFGPVPEQPSKHSHHRENINANHESPSSITKRSKTPDKSVKPECRGSVLSSSVLTSAADLQAWAKNSAM